MSWIFVECPSTNVVTSGIFLKSIREVRVLRELGLSQLHGQSTMCLQTN